MVSDYHLVSSGSIDKWPNWTPADSCNVADNVYNIELEKQSLHSTPHVFICRTLKNTAWLTYCVATIMIVLVMAIFVTMLNKSTPLIEISMSRPQNLKVVAIIFYGRPRYVNILDCYLRQNLVSNGGYIDQVIFADNVATKESEQWLNDLIASEPSYKKHSMKRRGIKYADIWREVATEKDTLYFKIDDDMVYIAPDAIQRMTHTMVNHPEAYAVAANVIGSPVTNWLHYHNDAILPYLPEEWSADEFGDPIVADSWRASELPMYTGTARGRWQFPVHSNQDRRESFKLGFDDPIPGRRWLPLTNNVLNMKKTPVAAGASYDAFGHGLWEWTMAAQQHYSFLDRLETKTTNKYFFGNDEGLWITHERYNINLIAIWGRNIMKMHLTDDDEQEMSKKFPDRLDMKFIIDGRAITSHFAYGPARPQLDELDLKERYRLYANEMVCSKYNQRPRLGEEFQPHGEQTPLGESDEFAKR